MRFLELFGIFLLSAGLVFSQKPLIALHQTDNKPILKFRNEIKVGGFGEYMIAKKFLDDQDRLLVVTNFGLQYWNVKTGERVWTRPHEIFGLEKIDSLVIISPDGKKLILTDAFNLSLKKFLRKKAKITAPVYDLETGKQLALLQRPDKPIRNAVWTPDGKTLLTFSSGARVAYNMEIAIWDGETFEYRASVIANGWNYLTRGGQKILTTAGVSKNGIGFKYEKPNSVNIWNARTGELEKSYQLTKDKSFRRIQITDDERFFLAENDKQIFLLNLETGAQRNFYAKDSTSIDSVQISDDKRFLAAENEGKILVWETAGGEFPKFEIAAPASGKQKLSTDLLGFNFDGRHIAVWNVKKESFLLVFKIPTPIDAVFYDLETGKPNPEMKFYANRRSAVFSPDGKYAIKSGCEKATLSSLEKAHDLYTFPLHCKRGVTTSFDGVETKSESYYYTDDIITFHPRKNVGIVIKDEALEAYSVSAEEKRLQVIYAPRPQSKKFVPLPDSAGSFDEIFASIANMVQSFHPEVDASTAGFLFEGDLLFTTSADLRSVFFWEIDKNLIE